ncbi:MAG: YunG family protein [Actinomycetota bacterium]
MAYVPTIVMADWFNGWAMISQTIDIETARLSEIFQRCWSKETSLDPQGWTPDIPAWGQCAVTALIIQDIRGGSLMKCRVGHVSHYWNLLPGGVQVDLTREQFGSEFDRKEIQAGNRLYVLSFPETVRRYVALKKALELRGIVYENE